MNTLLETRDLCKEYRIGKDGRVEVLKKVNLSVGAGEFLSVMGPSGSGKSTLLYGISGMDRISSGSVRFEDRELSTLSERDMARIRLKDMGFIFQHIHLLKNLSLRDNIVLSGYLAKKFSRKEVSSRAARLMERTGIEALGSNDIGQASGGQLQRVGICRSLINAPSIVFGDEPTGALDSRASAGIMELLAEINREGTTVMLVTHDIKVAARTERIVCMIDGGIAAEKRLGKFEGGAGEERRREEELSRWLLGLGL